MNWILEKCDKCGIWKPIGTQDKPDIFSFIWQFENNKKVCPACKPQPELNMVKWSMRFTPSIKLEPGVFIRNVII